MWSLYANNHQGVCYEFRVARNDKSPDPSGNSSWAVHPVFYFDQRPVFSLTDLQVIIKFYMLGYSDEFQKHVLSKIEKNQENPHLKALIARLNNDKYEVNEAEEREYQNNQRANSDALISWIANIKPESQSARDLVTYFELAFGFVKARAWQGEHEWRSVIYQLPDDPGIKTLSDNIRLEGIYLGANCGDSLSQKILDAVSNFGPSARVTKMHLSDSSYELLTTDVSI